jgi:hypothetical protein
MRARPYRSKHRAGLLRRPRSARPPCGTKRTLGAGLVSITPEYRVRVSPAMREKWSNGRCFYQHEGRPIAVPQEPELRPSRAALEWHARNRFVA